MSAFSADNPILVQVHRGTQVESVHRGAWALVDRTGQVREGAGQVRAPIFSRSAVKCLQALPLVESGAADAAGYGPEDLALALASHSGEPRHTNRVASILERLELGVEGLDCGSQPPNDPGTRRALAAAGEAPSALHNNCSGKHAGFLALARHLGADPGGYLDPEGPVQAQVRDAMGELTGQDPAALEFAIDGCSAPTWRVPLVSLGRAFARVANPGQEGDTRRAACERLTAAAAAHPSLVAGSHGRICTELLEASGGRLFPKIGAEAVYAVGVRGADVALVMKIDDGAFRAVHALVVHLLAKLELLGEAQLEPVRHWADAPLTNWAGREVGRMEVIA
jgi:L-asparaginase II